MKIKREGKHTLERKHFSLTRNFQNSTVAVRVKKLFSSPLLNNIMSCYKGVC